MAVVNDSIRKRAIDVVRLISRKAKVRAAYLFGSHVKGTPHELSDIDIAVFVDDAAQWDMRKRALAATEVQLKVDSAVELHIFPAGNLIAPDPASFAAYIQQHGLKLEV